LEKTTELNRIGLGGGCHWCTEAVYQSLLGVQFVEQGFIAAINDEDSYSEAVIVHFDPRIIPLEILIEIHLYTHESTTEHSMRDKYRSAIYTYSDTQPIEIQLIIRKLQQNFSKPIITKILPFHKFRLSIEKFQNYYYSNPDKPFCKNYINPKLHLLQKKFSTVINADKFSSRFN